MIAFTCWDGSPGEFYWHYSNSPKPMPEIQAEEAAVLVEAIKDMVYQCYVRTAKLRAAMKMRRYFAAEQAEKITSIDRHTRRAESA